MLLTHFINAIHSTNKTRHRRRCIFNMVCSCTTHSSQVSDVMNLINVTTLQSEPEAYKRMLTSR